MEDHAQLDWWCFSIWELKFPLKNKLFFRLVLDGKIPVWDTLMHRFLAGPNRCPLCEMDVESIAHRPVKSGATSLCSLIFLLFGQVSIYNLPGTHGLAAYIFPLRSPSQSLQFGVYGLLGTGRSLMTSSSLHKFMRDEALVSLKPFRCRHPSY